MFQKSNKNLSNDCIKVLLIILFCIVVTPIFTSKIYVGHDSLFHYQRIEELAISLRNGAIFPTLQSGALGGQGYASPLFYPDIFLLIPAFFVILGLDRFDALSLFMFILNIVTFIISYFSLECFLKIIKN